MPPEPPLHPYLGLKANLSLSWLSQLVLTIILLCVALGTLLSNLTDIVQDAKSSYAASCNAVESGANVMINLPHYMADDVNELNAKAVSTVVQGSAWVIDSSLLAIKTIIIFMIDTYRSLFLCLLEFAIHGTLDVLVAAIQSAQDGLNTAVSDLTQTIESAVSGVNSAIDKVADTIDKIPGVDLGDSDISVDLSKVENITIGSDAIAAIQNLNSSIPTFDDIKNALDSLVAQPIDDLRARVATTLSNATIDIEQLPVPSKTSLAMCTNLDTSFIDTAGHTMSKFAKISIALLSILAVLAISAQAFLARHRYRRMRQVLEERRTAWLLDSNADPQVYLATPSLLSLFSALEHPRLSSLIDRLATWLKLGPSGKNSMRWAGSYVFHPSATLFLLLGLGGLILTEIQLAILEGPIKRAVSRETNAGISALSDTMVAKMQDAMSNSSEWYAMQTNAAIETLATSVNDGLFGWVNETTTTMNTSMNAFYSDLSSTLNSTFASTPLSQAVNELLFCVVGSKVAGISTALTWLHDNAHINFPTVSNDTLLPSSGRMQELTGTLQEPSSSVAPASIVERLVDRYAQVLRSQRLTYVICLVIWLVVVLCAVIGLLWAHGPRDRWTKGAARSKRRRRSSCTSFGEKSDFMRPFALHSAAKQEPKMATEPVVVPLVNLDDNQETLRPPPAARFDWLRWTPSSAHLLSSTSSLRDSTTNQRARTSFNVREKAGAWAGSLMSSLRERQSRTRTSDGWLHLDERHEARSTNPFATPFDDPHEVRVR